MYLLFALLLWFLEYWRCLFQSNWLCLLSRLLFLGVHDWKYLWSLIAGPNPHDFVLWGTYDARCDGFVPAIARVPSDASGVQVWSNSPSRVVHDDISRLDIHGLAMLRVVYDWVIKEYHSFISSLEWVMFIMEMK